MDVNNIQEGQVIKNYKELCGLLGEESKTGNSKKAQLKDWQRYFDYGRKGNQFIIERIYDTPLPKPLSDKSIYVKAIEILLMSELAVTPGNRCVYTKTKLFKLLGMINENYLKNREYVTSDELKEYDAWEVSHFFDRANQKMSDVLFSALNSMRRRCLIEYTEKTIIVERSSNGILVNRVASVDEIENILRVKKEILKEMGYSKLPFSKFKKYYKKVDTRLHEKYGWESTYREYEITYLQDYMKSDIEVVKKELADTIVQNKIQLNCDIISALTKQAERLFDKHRTQVQQRLAIGNVENTMLGEFVYPANYLEVQSELTEFLLRI